MPARRWDPTRDRTVASAAALPLRDSGTRSARLRALATEEDVEKQSGGSSTFERGMGTIGDVRLDRVAERQRAVALARHYREAEGLSIVQIAERLGRAPATVKGYF